MIKRILVGLAIAGALSTTAYAKIGKVFDLKEQYFSGTMIKKGKEGYGQENKYELEKVIVTTDTIFNVGRYMYGLFTVDIKEPLVNWNVNIKKKNGTDSINSTTTIRLTSHIGNSYFISFNAASSDSNDYIQINDKNFKIGRMQRNIYTTSISVINGKTIFSINGKRFLKIDANNFGNLEKIEVEVNDNTYDDELLALDIYKVK